MSEDRVLAAIAECADAGKLRAWLTNAKTNERVFGAVFQRLIEVAPASRPGTIEHAFEQVMHAGEELISTERGKTFRFARTRQKYARVGAVRILKDWMKIPASQSRSGFDELITIGRPDLTGEAIVLRFAELFEPAELETARQRLAKACT
jgi:hypothetical protein